MIVDSILKTCFGAAKVPMFRSFVIQFYTPFITFRSFNYLTKHERGDGLGATKSGIIPKSKLIRK